MAPVRKLSILGRFGCLSGVGGLSSLLFGGY